jgi:hypothetical protein
MRSIQRITSKYKVNEHNMNSKPNHSSIKDVAEKYANAVWNDKDLTIIDKFIHQDVVIHSLLGNFYEPKSMKDIVQTWLIGLNCNFYF